MRRTDGNKTDVLVLTGFNEPNALAVVANDGSGNNHIFHLYVREKNPKAELWDGARSGTRAAVDVFNADEVRGTKPRSHSNN